MSLFDDDVPSRCFRHIIIVFRRKFYTISWLETRLPCLARKWRSRQLLYWSQWLKPSEWLSNQSVDWTTAVHSFSTAHCQAPVTSACRWHMLHNVANTSSLPSITAPFHINPPAQNQIIPRFHVTLLRGYIFISLLYSFWKKKIKRGLWNHFAVCLSIRLFLSICLCIPIIF